MLFEVRSIQRKPGGAAFVFPRTVRWTDWQDTPNMRITGLLTWMGLECGKMLKSQADGSAREVFTRL